MKHFKCLLLCKVVPENLVGEKGAKSMEYESLADDIWVGKVEILKISCGKKKKKNIRRSKEQVKLHVLYIQVNVKEVKHSKSVNHISVDKLLFFFFVV